MYKIQDYLEVMHLSWFSELALVASFALITAEFLAGMLLITNVNFKLGLWLSSLLMIAMTPLTLWIALTNPVTDCGCFGDAIVLTNWQTFWKNIVLILLAIILIALRKSVHALWQTWMECVIAVVAIVVAVLFMAWTKNHLPVKDFRPYKIGNHIPTLMEYPEDAEPDQYEISLIYAKEGVEQTFTLENYPKGDSTWTYIRTESKLIKKGYEPPIHDFEIINAYGEDITWDILESEDPITLVIMYDLTKADKNQMDKVERLLDDEAKGYILTGSSTDEIIALSLKYPTLSEKICTCDPVTLKTIVRANPGVTVVQNGVIIDKYNIRNR